MHSEWPMWRHNPARTGGDGSAVYPPLEQLWRFEAEGNVVDSIAVAGDLVCFGAEDNKLYGIDASTGGERWIVGLQQAAAAAPAIAGGQVFFCCGDQTVRALDADSGQERWCYQTKDRLIHAPAVGDGRVFVASGDKMLYCLNADNGEVVWSVRMKKDARTPPIYEDGLVWADPGDVCRFDARNGSTMHTSKALNRLAFVSKSVGVCGWKTPWWGGGDRFLRVEHDNIDQKTWQVEGVRAASVDELQTYIFSGCTVETMPHPEVEADGWTAFVDEELAGLDTGSPFTPRLLFALAGPVLYVTSETAGLRAILRAIWTDPSVVMKRWSVSLQSRPMSISVGSGRLFTSDGQGGVTAFRGGTREVAQRLLTPGDAVHVTPSLKAKVVVPGGGQVAVGKGGGVSLAGSARLGWYRGGIMCGVKYKGFVEPFKQLDGFGSPGSITWPKGCSLCGEYAVKSETWDTQSFRTKIPYCASCYQRCVQSDEEQRAVAGDTRTMGVLTTFAFRNERYWAQFMMENGLR